MTDRAGAGDAAGRKGRWTALLALWVRSLVFTGLQKTLALLLPTLLEQFQTKAWVMGAITAQVPVVAGLSGPFVKSLMRALALKPGHTVMLCGVLISTGFIVASFTTSPLQLALFAVVLPGFSSAVSGILLKEVVAYSFDENYATAVSLAKTGYSVGFFVFPPLLNLFLVTYGWRGAMLLMGALFLHLRVQNTK